MNERADATKFFRMWRRARVATLALALALIASGALRPAFPQEEDCAALGAERDALAQAAQAGGRWAAAASRQRAEIERTRNYADQVGCGRDLFSSEADTPRCAALTDRIARMEANLERLGGQADAARDGERLRGATQRYDALCGAGVPVAPAPGDAPGVGGEGARVMPVDPDAPPDAEEPAKTGRPSKALCVRQCDGGFFPIADNVTPDRFEGLGRLCKALCPNTEANLYTTSESSGDIATAVAADGAPYTALPAAFKYQKSFDAACSCKPPHQSWAEALAEAERLLEADRHDVVVTQQISDAMARPSAPGKAVPDRPARTASKPRRKPARNDGGLAGVTPPTLGDAPQDF